MIRHWLSCCEFGLTFVTFLNKIPDGREPNDQHCYTCNCSGKVLSFLVLLQLPFLGEYNSVGDAMYHTSHDASIARHLVERAQLLVRIARQGSERCIAESEKHKQCKVCYRNPYEKKPLAPRIHRVIEISHTIRSAYRSRVDVSKYSFRKIPKTTHPLEIDVCQC